jgi:hypothetical protein
VEEGTLQSVLNALINNEVTLLSGTLAYLTREAYLAPFVNFVDPILLTARVIFNIITQEVQIYNTENIFITPNDLFINTDWIISNQLVT